MLILRQRFRSRICVADIADLEIGIRARLAYTLAEPANVSYSSKGFLIQLPAFAKASSFVRLILPLINQDMLYERSRGHLAWAKSSV